MSENKCVIVTGASSGIGRATGLKMAAAGYHVVLVARSRERLEEAAHLARAQATAGAEVLALPADLIDDAATSAVVARTAERFGRIDALANVAGMAPNLPIEQITTELWRQCIESNLGYVISLTAAAWPIFRRQNGGVIVNVSSLASLDPFPGFSIYAAAKVGLNMFTRCTASEGKRINLTAVALALGAVETPMLRKVFNEKIIPRDKTLDPENVAAAIRDYITGARAFESGSTVVMKSP